MDTREKIVSYLREKGHADGLAEDLLLSCDYLDQGLLTSVEFVEFIDYLERTFSLEFSFEELQAPSFRSLAGIISSLDRKAGDIKAG